MHSPTLLTLTAILMAMVTAVLFAVWYFNRQIPGLRLWTLSYLFGLLFMSCAGYTLLRNEHVRIDLISNRFSRRGQAWIDILGILFFLLPMAIAIMVLSWPVFVNAWLSNEMSNSAGGLPMWPARLMIPAGFLLLILQASSELIKRIGFLRGACPDPTLKKNAPSAEEELAAVIKAHAQQGDAK